MQRTSFILALALLVVATTLAITITVRQPAPLEASASGPPVRWSGASEARPRDRSLPAPPATSSKSVRPVPESERFSVSVPGNHPQHALLAAKAEKVELEANFQLDRLTKQLKLTGEQRRRLFPILARASKDYDPAHVVVGLPSGSSALVGSAGNRELDEVLDPPQRDQLVEESITDLILWQEIIDNLRKRLDEQTPRWPDAAEPDPSVPTPGGRGNLYDVVEPQPGK
jgi:hypothetical protein